MTSFGFKHGIPSESDIMVDVRFIPNPYYVKSLKKLTGNNKKIVNYVFKSDLANEFVDKYHALIKELIPGYIHEGEISSQYRLWMHWRSPQIGGNRQQDGRALPRGRIQSDGDT